MIGHSQHDPVGLQEVVDRRALLQEFGVAHDRKRMCGLAADGLAYEFRCADRHGALVHDDAVSGHRARHFAGRTQHVLQVRRAVFAHRRPDRDEDHVRLADRGLQIEGEGQALFCGVALDQFLEAGLEDRDLAASQRPDFCGVLVHTDDLVACLRKTRADHQADVSRSHHCNPHARLFVTGSKS